MSSFKPPFRAVPQSVREFQQAAAGEELAWIGRVDDNRMLGSGLLMAGFPGDSPLRGTCAGRIVGGPQQRFEISQSPSAIFTLESGKAARDFASDGVGVCERMSPVGRLVFGEMRATVAVMCPIKCRTRSRISSLSN